MSKPLEMPIHPKLKWPRRGSEIEPYRKQWKAENALRLGKRFTDSQLAAELWHSVSREAEAEVRGRRPGGDVDYWSKINRESVRQTRILERFVSMPSYDEAPE